MRNRILNTFIVRAASYRRGISIENRSWPRSPYDNVDLRERLIGTLDAEMCFVFADMTAGEGGGGSFAHARPARASSRAIHSSR